MTQNSVNPAPLGPPAGIGSQHGFMYCPDTPVPLFDRMDGSFLHPSPSSTAEHCVEFWSTVEVPDAIISQSEAAYLKDRDREVDDDMVAAMATWTDDWAARNPEGKKTPKSTEERNAKYRSEHEAHRLSILHGVEAKRPPYMGSYDSRQPIRAHQMITNRPNSSKFPEESDKVLDY